MSIRIVTDSTCDLPAEVVAEHGITVVPLYINVGDKGYLDGVDMSREEFYERLPEFDPPPTTATPGPRRFQEAYEKLADEGATEVLSIHISISLSATVDSARLGAQETKAVPVTVFDSRQLTLGTGFQVLEAAKAAVLGKSMDEILAVLDDLASRSHVFAALDTLEFLRRSGRMNWAMATLGSWLQVKPLLRMHDGNPTADRVRTAEAAMKRLVQWLTELVPLERVALVHSHAAERAQELLGRVRNLLPHGDVMSVEITPVLGAHLGPGAVGFACVTAGERG
jgi:DegV family protein with EDD domain